MIVKYIQSAEAQEIANKIHFINLQKQYDVLLLGRHTPLEIQQIWSAQKLFLGCSESEAITQYSLYGVMNGEPLLNPLQGVTTGYAIPSMVHQLDEDGAITDSYDDCIPLPKEDYDLNEFTYIIVEITIHES